MTERTTEILVFAHDAGGAEVISAYIKKHLSTKTFHVFVAGPAVKIFRRNGISFKRAPSTKEDLSRLIARYTHVHLVLLGSGWMTKIEFDALCVSKELGLKTAVYLESWVNYRERFGYPASGWRNHLPDEIWVGDRYALTMAKRFFRNTFVRFVPNQYFVNMKKEYRSLHKKGTPSYDILFFSDTVPGIEHIFEGLLAALAERGNVHRVLLGFHPADDRQRYDEVINRFPGVQVTRSNGKSLIRDLLRVRSVIGTETVAMVIALLVGKKTISIRMSRKKPMLPFPEIVHVASAREAVRLI